MFTSPGLLRSPVSRAPAARLERPAGSDPRARKVQSNRQDAVNHPMHAPAESKQRQYSVLTLVREPEGFAEVPELLSRDGFRPILPQNLDEAARMVAKQGDIGILLSDITWQDVRGPNIYQRLVKALPPNRSLSVIFLAESASINDVVAALRMQAVDFLHKPS